SELRDATPEKCTVDTKLIVRTLKQLMTVGVRHRFLGGRLIHNVLFGEIEAEFSSGEVPTAGLTLDADHVLALTRVHVLATT
ncbi:hypothetical protein, partial [Escherichia coli]|uniref:hypothetical protein n=1 Tax=Escherichia coli TaxID=562 RepID=UPI003D0946CB